MKNILKLILVIVIISFNSAAIAQYEGGDASGFTYGSIGSDGDEEILPIHLLEFSLNTLNDKIVIEWTTLSETNNKEFIIQKSSDMSNWENIGTIKGSGNSNSINNYSFIDEFPYLSITYYRIKQVDFDGNFSFTSVKSIITEENNLIVYPNPVSDFIFVEFTSTETNVEVFDILGNNISSSVDYSFINENKLKINLENLNSGIYFVKCGNYIIKFIIE